MKHTKQTAETIETRCQELARELNLLAKREIKQINVPKISSLVVRSMNDLNLKSKDYRWEAYNFVGFFLKECLSLDQNKLAQVYLGSTTKFEYEGVTDYEKNGFREGYFRTKSISSIISNKLIGAFITERDDIRQELKGFPTGLKDVFAFRMIIDHPGTPAVDFVRIYDEKNVKELLEVVEENREEFETRDIRLEDYAELSKKGFEHLFEKFCEVYIGRFEQKNEENLHKLARDMQKKLPNDHFELINVADLPVLYVNGKGKNHRATVASQKFIMSGDNLGERDIFQDFIVFEDDEGAKAFSDNIKLSAQKLKSDLGSNLNYKTIGPTESEYIERGVCIRYVTDDLHHIICQLKENKRVFTGFRGRLSNKEFEGEIFGSKAKKGILDATSSKNKADVKRAFAMRLMAVEAPTPYNVNHFTDESIFSVFYNMKKDDSRKADYFKDYITYPREMKNPDNSIKGHYKALHLVIKIIGHEYQDKLELQMKTGWQNFQSMRSVVSSNEYDNEKIRRGDPRKSKKAMPDTKGSERKKVCSFLDALEQAVFYEYERRINAGFADIEELFLDTSKTYNKKEERLNSIMDKIMHEFKMLCHESIELDKSKLMEKVGHLPYHLIELVPSIDEEAQIFLKNIGNKLEKEDFELPNNITYYTSYKNMRSLIDSFVKYASERKNEKSYSIALQAIAMFLDDYTRTVPGNHAEGHQNISRFFKIKNDERYFIKPRIIKIKPYAAQKKTLDFVPAGYSGFTNNKQVEKARDIVTHMLQESNLGENDIKKAISNIGYFIMEIQPSKKKPYKYGLSHAIKPV